jgi:hypothetical protein
MTEERDAAGVVPEPRMHEGSTSGPIIVPEGLMERQGIRAEMATPEAGEVGEGLGLPAPERVWLDEEWSTSRALAYRRAVAATLPGREELEAQLRERVPKSEGWADWPTPEPDILRDVELERREHNADVEDRAELADHEQEERRSALSAGSRVRGVPDPGGPGGVGFRANAGNRAGKSSARVYGFGDFTFEYNSLTGDVTVTSRTRYLGVEPVEPGRARLSSKRREGAPGVGIGE